jgi:hypothetical protein
MDETLSMVERLRIEFKNDPLFTYIQREGYETLLFEDDLYNKIFPESIYTTIDAARLLKTKDWQLRNYLKSHNLNSYIEVGKVGSQHRFDYRNIFKFKMILLLVERFNKKPIDIAYIVGIENHVTHYEVNDPYKMPNREVTPVNHSSNINNDDIKKFLILMQLQYQKELIERKIKEKQNEIEKWEREINDTVDKIELLELIKHTNIQNTKQNAAFITLMNKQQSKGIFKLFTRNKENIEDEYNKLIKEKEHDDYKHMLPDNINELYNKLVDKRMDLENRKEIIFEKIGKKIKQYNMHKKDIENKIGELKKDIDHNNPLLNFYSHDYFLSKKEED